MIVWLTEPADADLGGVWLLGIAFPWVVSRAVRRQMELAEQLDATRQELAEQALVAQRREIARDVHDLVGHGLAAMMLHVTGARHVLRRDPDAAEEALRAAEEQGRQSMRELRQTLTFLRDDEGVAAPVPTTRDISALVDNARAGGLAVELRVRGDLRGVDPGVGVAVYRIAQEALANAARHAPDARTVLGVTREGGAGAARCRRRPAGSPRRLRRHRLRARRHARARGRAGRRPRGRADARRLARDVPAAGGGARVIRVGLVDDQAIVRAGVARILSPEDGFEVVAECGDGVEAVDRAALAVAWTSC